MRGVAISVLVLGCSSSSTNEPGTLICKTEGKTFEARVPRNALAAVRDRAHAAQLTDCHFEAGAPVIAHWPEQTIDPVIPPPASPPPASTVPVNVPPSILETNRISGSKDIRPDDETQLEIRRSGKEKVIGSYKLCITIDGNVSTVSQLKSTGFSAYDGKIIGEMKTWRYLPYIYNGALSPVCTAVTFIYSVN